MYIKLETDLKDQLYKKKIFEKVAAYVHVIEFQKRGLPHAHMSVIFKLDYKLINPDDDDKYANAEIPCENKYSELLEMIAKHMMHGSCGKQNPNCSCMINGRYRFHCPKPFTSKII
uniref:Helitron helicase-like domain-containing protein n=1 Tax=Manihot esculenta TaxID=3983 RepID=A0A2C9U463_MANES